MDKELKWFIISRLVLAYVIGIIFNHIQYYNGTVYYPSIPTILLNSLITLFPFFLWILAAEWVYDYLTKEEKPKQNTQKQP